MEFLGSESTKNKTSSTKQPHQQTKSEILTAKKRNYHKKSKVFYERMPFGRKSPLEALANPGAILAYKYTQFRQKRREAASRRITEKELTSLHHKIVSLTIIPTILFLYNIILPPCYTVSY